MACSTPKQQTSFKVTTDNLSIWVNEYQGKYLIHFRQPSDDQTKPKKHYLFTAAPNVTELQVVCLRAWDADFKSQSIELTKTVKGPVYALELVRKEENGSTYFLLQSRNVEYKDALRYVKITDMSMFKNALEQVGKAYTTMIFNAAASTIARGPAQVSSFFKIQEKPELLDYEDELTRSSFPASYYTPKHPKMMI